MLGTDAGTLLAMRPESTLDKPSKRVINDRCYVWSVFHILLFGEISLERDNLLIPTSSFDSGKLFFSHSMSSREIPFNPSQPYRIIGHVGNSNTGKLTCGNFGINLDSGICRNPGFRELNSLVDGNSSISQYLRYLGFCCTSGFLTLDRRWRRASCCEQIVNTAHIKITGYPGDLTCSYSASCQSS